MLLLGPATVALAFDAAGTVYPGIDVSVYQGNIDFAAVAQSGIRMVYIRAGEGDHTVDTRFEQNYANAKANGLLVGLYYYATATTVAEAQTQARAFAALASGKSIDGRLALDFEQLGGLSHEQVNEIALAFLDELVSVSGLQGVLYSDLSNARDVFDARMTKYPLWIAHYGVTQPGDPGKWTSWAGFQYSDTGSVPGISGNVDLDHFTDAMLNSGSTGGGGGSTSGGGSNTGGGGATSNQYTVVVGDTLADIAIRNNTSVERLITLNNIANPHLIYAGQVLVVQAGDMGAKAGEAWYTIQRGDTLGGIAAQYGTSISALATLNGLQNPDLIYAGSGLQIR